MQQLRFGILLQLQDHVGKAGVEADEVARRTVTRSRPGRASAHRSRPHGARGRSVAMQVDHHAASLGAMLRQIWTRSDLAREPDFAHGSARSLPAPALHARPSETVVEDDLRLASPSAYERLPIWANESTASNIAASATHVRRRRRREARIVSRHRVAEILRTRALRRSDARRVAPRIEHVAPG